MVLPIRVLPLDGIDDAAQFRLYREGPHLEQPLGFLVKWLQFLERDRPTVVGMSRIGGGFPGLHAQESRSVPLRLTTQVGVFLQPGRPELGRASCQERWCPYV